MQTVEAVCREQLIFIRFFLGASYQGSKVRIGNGKRNTRNVFKLAHLDSASIANWCIHQIRWIERRWRRSDITIGILYAMKEKLVEMLQHIMALYLHHQ